MAEKKSKKKSPKASMLLLLVILFLICICALWLSGFDLGFGRIGTENGGDETLPQISETPVSVSETVGETAE